MDHDTQTLLETLSDEEPRSRLEDRQKLIPRPWRQSRTYRRIRQILAHKLRVHVSLATLYAFAQRRSRLVGKRAITPAGGGLEGPTVGTEALRLGSETEIRALREKSTVPPRRQLLYTIQTRSLLHLTRIRGLSFESDTRHFRISSRHRRHRDFWRWSKPKGFPLLFEFLTLWLGYRKIAFDSALPFVQIERAATHSVHIFPS
jgi:hypothetical protein